MASQLCSLFSKREPVLSPDQLKRLDRHEYKCESCSLMDPYMQGYWNWLVKQVPMSLAPNLITITGLIINIVTTLILISYSPDAQSPPPRWASLLCAVGLFIYQSLDAIDGKQARRTGSSSPLGELFDHGCDSLSTVFVAVGSCVSLQLGTHPGWMLFKCIVGIMLFYCAHWQTYVSGELKFGKIDVTEAQFVIIVIHLVTAIFGPELWYYQVPLLILHVELKLVLVLIGSLATITTMCENFTNITTAGVGKSGSSVAGTSVLSPSIPISLVVIPAYMIYLRSEQQLYETHPCLYIITFGLVAAKVTNCLVIAHMTKSEMEYVDSVLFGPLLLFLNQYFNFFLPEYFVLWVCCVWSCFDLYRYCSKVCMEICNYLGIKLFTISAPTKPAPAQSSSSATPSAKSPQSNRKSTRPQTRAQQRLNKP